MTDEAGGNPITLGSVEEILTSEGYETTVTSDQTLQVKELDSGITLHLVLEDNILFCTVSCVTVPADAVTPELMRKMLDADNGISTSGFQLYNRDGGTVVVTLNNFCKLQAMGEDDRDDILSCLEFLVVDVCAAKEVLGELASHVTAS